MQTRIRAPEPGDEVEVAALAAQLGYPSSPEQVGRRLSALKGRQEHFVAFAVTPDNRPVGWAHAYLARRLQSDVFVEIGGMVVAQEIRGQGIGASLLAAVEVWARSKASAKVRVRSNVIRGRAHAFYLQCGYQQGKTTHVFEKRLDDAPTCAEPSSR
jgi:GNAT superfamily N-acetyltransferase